MADPADLEQLAVRLEQSGDYRILRRVPVVTRYADDDPAALKRLGLIVDIETTGLDPASDRIIELACLPFHFSSEGAIYDVLPGYAGFEDPGQPLHDEVVRLTRVTDEQLFGQTLDEQAVTTLATPANLIIAHNAAFDRCFLERRFPVFVDKPWACSMRQVPWAEEGWGSAKLDYLLNRCGFFFDDHRAMADCRVVLHPTAAGRSCRCFWRPPDSARSVSGRSRRRSSVRTCSRNGATAGTAAVTAERAPGIATWIRSSSSRRSDSWPRRSMTAAIAATSSSGSTTATGSAIGFDHAATASRSAAVSS
jgi:hypothetical protein